MEENTEDVIVETEESPRDMPEPGNVGVLLPDEVAEEVEETETEVKPESESDDQETSEEEQEEQKPPKRRRRSEARRDRREMQRRIDDLSQQVEELKKPAAAEAQTDDLPPVLDDFAEPQEWAKAMQTWTTAQARKATAEAEEAQKQKAIAEEAQKARDVFEKRQDDFAAGHGDYDDLVHDDDTHIGDIAAQFIWNSEHGPAVAYHLAQNQDESRRITEMSDFAALAELARVEARIAEQAPASGNGSTAPNPQPSRAPRPPKTVGGGTTAIRDPSKMSDAEYRTWREGQPG